MIEDKLSHDERLRLECVAQAVSSSTLNGNSAEGIVYKASKFEDYIRNGSKVEIANG